MALNIITQSKSVSSNFNASEKLKYSQNSQYKTDSDYYNESNKLTVYTTYTCYKDRLRKQQDRRLNIIQVLPSYEVNIESCQPKGGCLNNLLGIDKLMFNSYEGNNCFIIPKLHLYSKMFKTWMFCFAKDNKIIYNYGTGLKKTPDFQHTSGCHGLLTGLQPVVNRPTTYCFPLHYICLGCSLGGLHRQQIFRKRSLLYSKILCKVQ